LNDLISIDSEGKISAKETYDFLELNPTHFARWAKSNIEQDEFYQEGVDWWGFAIMANGNETKDYKLTIDFAKHLCMLSRSAKGKQARNYFIEIEKRAKELSKPQSIEDLIIMQAQSMKEVRLQIAQQGEAIKQLEAKTETRNTDYYTIAGYASLRGINVDVSKASLLGRKASKLSVEYGYETGKTHDPRFGHVKTYHVDILKEIFAGLEAPKKITG